MNISKDNLKFSLEWHNASHHLKELNNDGIPTSQNIDYNSSEDEEYCTTFGKGRLLFLKNNDVCNNIQNNEETQCKETSKFKFEGSISPVLKAKFRRSPCLSRRIRNNNLRGRSLVKNIYKSSDKSVIRNLNKNDFNHSCATSAIKFNENIKSSSLQINSSETSPILKSRLNKKSLDKCFISKKAKLDTIRTDIDDSISNLNNSSIKQVSDTDSYKISYNEPKEKHNVTVSDPLVNESFDVEESDIHIDFLNNTMKSPKLSKLNDAQKDELKFMISDCLSPNTDFNRQENISVTPSIETQESEAHNSMENGKKGSEWLKVLQETTPNKYNQLTNGRMDCIKSDLDSAKKKIKRNGFAHQLQKLIHFWQSNVTMWNHQMSLASINSEVSCSQSQTLSESRLSGQNVSCPSVASPLLGGVVRTKTKSRFSNRSLCSLFFKKDEKADRVQLKQFGKTSPLTTCVRNLRDSLEIGNSDSSLSSKSSFVIPTKHLCVKILKIDWQTPLMTSATCREIDRCSLNHLNSDQSLKKFKTIRGIFGRSDIKTEKELEVGATVKVFAPWQILEMKSESCVTIFTSYYLVVNLENKIDMPKKLKRVTKIASWECPCLRGFHMIPSMCNGGHLNVFNSDRNAMDNHAKLRNAQNAFNSVTDTTITSSPKCDRYWTILEALEQCGGLPDIPVALTLRIRRIYKMRNYNNTTEHYMILGQDPSGTFAVLEIPNRPLKSTLKYLLEDGLNTTRTLTHLSVQQRIVNSQDAELFSLITSLEAAYKNSIARNPGISSLLQDQIQKPTQSYCYKFLANLGQTMDYKIVESEALRVTLPQWTLKEASELESGRRGSIDAIILYYIHPHVYAKCRNGDDSMQKLIVNCSHSFPGWINCDGTIMVAAVVEDVLTWRGSFVLDKFSRFQKLDDEVRINMIDLLAVTPVLKKSSKAFDLVSVCGIIKSINDGSAYVWEECNICGGCDLHSINKNNLKCQTCKTENVGTVTRYSLEVELSIRFVDESDEVAVVKLYQTTIKSILKGLSTNNNQYCSEDLLTTEVGPLLCYVKSIERKSSRMKFVLLELPY